MGKPTIPEVLARFKAYHKLPGNEAWGALHIVLEDGNIGDDSVRGCIEWASDRGDVEGTDLARILLTMSKTQRVKIGRVACAEPSARL